jgi:uncharacterized protein YndB with AHSA1/START domain
MTDQRHVQISRTFTSTPESVFRALIHPLELTFWFCHYAWTEPVSGGDFWMRWRNGWWARGLYRAVESPRRVEMIWKGKDEPAKTDLVFRVDAGDQGTTVTVTHSGYGTEPVWAKALAEAERSWPPALQNLESVLTSGIDLRVANTPVLGIVPDELTVDRATAEGIGVDTGIYLVGVLDGGAAEEAGLKAGDVIVSIGGLGVTDLDTLATTLARYEAGEMVLVRYVRADLRDTVSLTLQPRRVPEISFDPEKVVAQAREQNETWLADLWGAVEGLTEVAAAKRPSPDSWSVRETLAHLSLTERANQNAIADLIAGTSPGQRDRNPTALPEMIHMVLTAAPTVEALQLRLKEDLENTLAAFASLGPDVVAMKARYRAMATLVLDDWLRWDHLDRIRLAVQRLG